MNGDLVIDFEQAFEPMRCLAYRAAYRLLGERPASVDIAAYAEPWVILPGAEAAERCVTTTQQQKPSCGRG